MVSTDRGLFNNESNVHERFKDYGQIFEKLDVIVFTKRGFEKTQISENVTIYPTNSFSKINYIGDAIKIGAKLSADVVSSQDAFLTGLSARKIAQIIKAKFHIQIHTDIFSKEFWNHSLQNKLHSFVAKILLPQADGIRVVSKRILESLSKLKLKSEPVVLPILVQYPKESSMCMQGKHAYNILTVSRLEKEKNIELAIDAFALVAKERSDIGLTIVGAGSLLENLKEKAKILGVLERIDFVGNVTNVSDYYRLADIYIQTSKYEGYGMALIEAALYELPIVSTDVGIVGEVLVDGGSVLTAKSAAADFAVKINQLLDDDGLRKNIGERAKEMASSHIKNKEQYLSDFKKAFTV